MFNTLKKLTFFFFLITLCACIKKDDLNSLVPGDTKVDFILTSALVPLDGDYYRINSIGYKANGVVLFNYGNNNFRAFDLTCPTECLEVMNIDASGIMTGRTCDNQKITFTQYQTSVTIDETTYSLREYYTRIEGGGVRITNF